MIGIGGKPEDGVPADISCLGIVEGGNLVGDIQDTEIGIYLQELTPDGARDIILQSEVRSKGNDRHQ
jgi:hypothetical protein